MSLKSTSIIGLILALACNSQKGSHAGETAQENAALTAGQLGQEQPGRAKQARASDSQEADEVEEADEDSNDDADEVEEADEDANDDADEVEEADDDADDDADEVEEADDDADDDADEAEQDDGGDSAKSATSHGQRGAHGSSMTKND